MVDGRIFELANQFHRKSEQLSISRKKIASFNFLIIFGRKFLNDFMKKKFREIGEIIKYFFSLKSSFVHFRIPEISQNLK